MLVLSLDTCDARGSVCLVRDGVPGVPIAHPAGQDYSTWLLPALQRCLDASSASYGALDAFAVATGPGSFTGVRVGLATVKALAEAFRKPIAGISRLLAIATTAAGDEEWIASVADAGRGELFGALYRSGKEGPALHGSEMVGPPSELVSEVSRVVPQGGVRWGALDADALLGAPAWNSRARHGDALQLVEPVLAPVLGRIGYERFRHGELTDALHLDANYVRRSDAERFWKARPAGHGS